MLLFAASSILFLSRATSMKATYSVYFNGVKHGIASSWIEEDKLQGETILDFSPSSKLTAIVGDGSPVYAKLEISGKTPTTSEVQVGNEIRAKVGSKFAMIDGSKGLLPYFTTQPILAKYVLDKYGSKPDGFRSLPVFDLAKLKVRPLSASLDRVEMRDLGGHQMIVKVWRIDSAPNPESVVFTDSKNYPLEWWIPSFNFEMVRQGFESLRPSAHLEGMISPAHFKVKIEKDIGITLRNGLKLKADVYRPNAPGKYPVVLQRTCYDRTEFGDADGEYFASRGYVYVAQTVRGRGGSEGSFEPEQNEAEDGYDTVRWCASQSWSTGKVGMIGASYNAFCCWMAAKTHPKGLTTIVSVVPMPGSPNGSPWPGGTQYVGSTLSWYGLLRDPLKTQPFNVDLTKALNTLPIANSDLVAFGHHVPEYQKRIRPNSFDAQVKKTSYRFELGAVRMPVMYLDGWFDTVSVGTRLNYNMMRANGNTNQKLIWGPWDHFTNRESKVGDSDPGPQGYISMNATVLRWFDRWLKGRPNGIDKEPMVEEFVMGANRWVKSDVWPPKNMHPHKWYLRQNQLLSAEKPKNETPSKFTYDPAKWVAGANLQSSFFFLLGGDCSSLCRRPDVLIYESKPLAKTMRLDGPILGRLYASTSAKDTDWAMALLDVHPDGKAISLATGLIRARYRYSFATPKLLQPNEKFAYNIDMWQTGIQIPAGHRLRVAVLSTLFPDRDRNLNTGEPIYQATRMVTAKQTIYHDGDRLSFIELPIAPPIVG